MNLQAKNTWKTIASVAQAELHKMRHQVGTRIRPISRLCAVCLTHLSHDVPSNYVTDMSVALLCKEYKKVYMEFKESVVGKGEQEDIENSCSSPTVRPCLTLAEVLLLSKKSTKKKHLILVSIRKRQDIGNGLLQAPSNDSADVRIWVALATRGLRNVAEADTSQYNLSSPL